MPITDFTTEIRQKLGPTIPGYRDTSISTMEPLRALQRVEEGLSYAEREMRRVLSAGRWTSRAQTCDFLGIAYYDQECSPVNISTYIWPEPTYAQAQMQLANALAIDSNAIPTQLRYQWCDLVMRWLSVAHAATAVRNEFLYSTADFSQGDDDVQLVGPAPARNALAGIWQTSLRNGHQLFFPISLSSIFALSDYPNQHETSIGATSWSQGSLSASHFTGSGARLTYDSIGPGPSTPVELLSDCLQFNGNQLVPIEALDRSAVDSLKHTSLYGGYDTDVLRRMTAGRVVPSWLPIHGYLSRWARHIVDTTFTDLLTHNAWDIYWEYLQRFPPETFGMTRDQLNQLNEDMARARVRAAGAPVTALGSAGGIIFLAVALVVQLALEFIPLAYGCPAMPRPFLYRSFRDPDCAVGVEGQTVNDMLVRLQEMGSRVGYQFLDPRYATDVQDPVKDPTPFQLTQAGKLLIAAFGVAVGVVGAKILEG